MKNIGSLTELSNNDVMSFIAVSYTHLRAHETPEHLVCRLLLEKKSFSLGLQIISNQEIALLNQKWMQKNGPTDVLSFPIISNESLNNLDHIELGDIFISLDMALEQSYEYKHSIYKEMIWLASHGFLHLLGWEHNNEHDLENMLNFQEYLITRLD